jgi:hypothetical protein
MPSVVMLATFDGGKFTVGTSSVKVVEPLSIVWNEEYRDQPAENVIGGLDLITGEVLGLKGVVIVELRLPPAGWTSRR